MPVPSHIINCTRKQLIAPGVYELAFTKPEGFRFVAGQFVLFDVPLPEDAANIEPRAYSIASSPGEPELLFVIKLKPGGRGSRWVEELVTAGTNGRIQGPFGFFTVKPQESAQIIFVATGAGLAPFRSHIKWLLEEQKDHRPLNLIFGVRNREDVFWMNQFEELARTNANFHLHVTLTAPPSDWGGLVGRVQAALPTVIADRSTVQVYICGAPEMVTDVKKMCLEALALPKAHVHGEGYI